MKNLFKRTNMMAEAKLLSKVHTPFIETLIFLAVFYVGNFAQSLFIMPALFYYVFTDGAFADVLSQLTPENPENFYNYLLEKLANLPEWLYITILFATVTVAVVTIIYCKFIEKRSLKSLGLRSCNYFLEYGGGLLLGAVLICFVDVIFNVLDIAVFSINNFNALTLLVFFLAFAVKNFSNTLFIYGYYMTSMSKSTSVLYSMFCSSFLMATLNVLNFDFIILPFINWFMFAFLKAGFVVKCGNIWAAAGLGTAWEFVSFSIFGFDLANTTGITSAITTTFDKGFDSVTGGIVGFNGGLITTLVVFLALGALFVMPQNTKEIYVEKNDEEN